MNRDSELYQDAVEEGDLDNALDELGDGPLDLEAVKGLPGADEFDDADLQSMLDEIQKENSEASEKPAAGSESPAAQIMRSWKVYNDKDEEVTDIDNMLVKDFLKHKLGYNAMGKEQKKALDEMVRVSQFGHLNEQKLQDMQRARESVARELADLQPKYKSQEQILNTLRYAMTQFAMGNDEPLQKVLNSFKGSLGREGLPAGFEGAAPSAEASTDTAGEVEGQRFYYEQVQPAYRAVVDQYTQGRSQEARSKLEREMEHAVQKYIADEPDFSVEKLDRFINYEIPLHLEQAGYSRGVQPAPVERSGNSAPADSATAKEIAELRAELAAMKKGQLTSRIRERNSKIPGGGNSDALGTETETDGSPPAEARKSRAAMKEWLRNR